MSQRKKTGEERVTAKSKPMMNLLTRCSERTPDVLASTASQSPEKTRNENQLPLSPQTEQHHRTERHVFSRTHQATQNGMLIKLGLLRNGNLMN